MKNKKQVLFCVVLLCFLTAAIGLFANKYREYNQEKTANKVILRFAVTSKTYVFDKSNTSLTNFIDKVYTYSDEKEYTQVDAFIINGNVTGDGSDEAFDAIDELTAEKLRTKSKLYMTMGEMDFVVGETDVVNDPGILEKIQDKVVNIKGYNFIFLSPVYSSYESKLQWLDETLNKLSQNSDKPIFLFQYSALKNTYYGTKSWYNIESEDILNVIEKYNNVIDFSSSSSNANNTVRSVFQNNATYINTGVATQLRMNYDEYGYDTSGEIITSDFTDVKQCQIVEVYGDGRIIVRPMDLNTGKIYTSRFDGKEINFNIITGNPDKYEYSAANSLSKNVPFFQEDTVIEGMILEDNPQNVSISFDNAIDEDGILFYKVSVHGNDTVILEKNTYSDFPLYETTGKKTCILEGMGEYDSIDVEIIPFDMFGNSGAAIRSQVSFSANN